MGFDDGAVVVKLGREEPAVSIDGSGKLIWARHNEVLSSIIKGGGTITTHMAFPSPWPAN